MSGDHYLLRSSFRSRHAGAKSSAGIEEQESRSVIVSALSSRISRLKPFMRASFFISRPVRAQGTVRARLVPAAPVWIVQSLPKVFRTSFFSFLSLRIVLLFLVLPEGSFDSSFDDKIADGGVDRDASGEEEDGEKIIHAAYLLCLLRLLRER